MSKVESRKQTTDLPGPRVASPKNSDDPGQLMAILRSNCRRKNYSILVRKSTGSNVIDRRDSAVNGCLFERKFEQV
jgi:hypothetical protein